MFEIAGDRTPRGQAHPAILSSPAYDPTYMPLQGEMPRAPEQRQRGGGLAWLGTRARRRPAFWLAAVGLGLVLGAVEEWVRISGPPPELGRLARAAGFGIDLVTLKGHRFTFDRDVFEALDLDNVKTFAALDTAAVKARIERLPWVDTAEISRVFPGRLDIRVTERKPFAVWARAGSHYLIDRTGRVLGAVSGAILPDLPRVAGEGAAAGATEMLETLARYPEIASRLSEIERVSDRRWRLKLANAATVELPADDEVAALEQLSHDADLARLVASGRVRLDFRGPGRVAVRPADPITAPGSAPGTGS